MERVEAAYGGFKPLTAFTNGLETVTVDALLGFDEVKRLPAKVKECQEARLTGELDFVVDDITAFRAMSRLLLVEEYCDRSRSLGFRVRLYVLDPRAKNRLVPLREMRSSLIPEGPRKSRIGGLVEAVQKRASRTDDQEGGDVWGP